MVENNNNNYIHLDSTELKGKWNCLNFVVLTSFIFWTNLFLFDFFYQSFQFKSNFSKFDISYFNILHIVIKVIAYCSEVFWFVVFKLRRFV
jgi:hypothetical protein